MAFVNRMDICQEWQTCDSMTHYAAQVRFISRDPSGAVRRRPEFITRGVRYTFTIRQSRIDEGAAQLLKLAERIDQTREGRPSFLMVLTSTACAYRRKDGVVVVPLACLGV